jgi:hypothetical protein
LQRFQDGSVKLADRCSNSGLRVDILNDSKSGDRKLLHRRPPVRAVVVSTAGKRGIRGFHAAGGGIAEYRREAAGHTPQARPGIPLIAEPEAEALDGIRQSARIELPKRVELLGS